MCVATVMKRTGEKNDSFGKKKISIRLHHGRNIQSGNVSDF